MVNFWSNLPKPIIALAPMAGVCDSPFRQICRTHGADVIYTEFLSSNALCFGNEKTMRMLKFNKSEHPIVCQLFGKDPATIAHAAKIIEQAGYDGIDLNFGCPAYKVVKNGGGVSLMRNLDKLRAVIAAAIDAVAIPVSIKIRASVADSARIRDMIEDEDDEDRKLMKRGAVTAVDLVKKIHDLDVSCIMIHARSYEQAFDGEPDLEIVKQVRSLFKGVLLTNGGIYTPEDAKKQLDETQADGVGLARGVRGNPWLFGQIKDYLKTGSCSPVSWNDQKQVILEHAKLMLKTKGEKSIIELRKHLAWYIRGLPGAKELRTKLVQIKSIEELGSILDTV